MTSASASFKRGKIAFTMGAVLLLSATFPFASVFADNAQGPDDLVVVVEPRLGTLLGNGIAVASTGNMFLFDYELFHADGSPYLVTEIMVDVHTVDGRADFEATWPTLIWSDNFVGAPSNKGVLRIPAGEIIAYLPDSVDGYYHEMPFGGMSITILAVRGAQGESLLDSAGHYPAGQHSLVANNLAEQGNYEEADSADETFTPIFLFNGQLSGLTQFGNPLINPGFEVGYQSGESPEDTDGTGIPAFTTAIPPWFLLSNSGDHVHSAVHIQGAGGQSGSSAVVRYNHDDNGEGLMFGQFFFVPGANSPGPWFGSSSVKAEFDIRARDEANLISNFHGLATLHWAESTDPWTEGQATRGRPAGIPTDNAWRHVTLDFGNVADAKQLTSFFFSFSLDSTSAPEGSQLVVELDNVRLTGARLSEGAVNPTTDLTDGYSAFIVPAASTVSSGEQVAQLLTGLADGESAYVFRVSAMDYTGIDPRVEDVTDAYSVFQLLDESYVPDLSHDPEAVVYNAVTNGANANTFFQFVEADGSVSDDLLVVVPASVAGSALVPWFFHDVATGDSYEAIYGTSEPVSGYHSAARNNMKFTNLADSMDYAFTPIAFVDEVGGSMAYETEILLTCPGQAINVMCSADPNPDLNVAVSTDSPIFETLTVELVANGAINETLFPGKVLGTGTVATPSGDATITLSSLAMQEMTNVSDMRVFARVVPGTFAEGAQTGLFRLDNFLPVASFTNSSLTNLFRNSVASFASTSSDPDGSIVSQVFEVHYLADASDDEDDVPLGLFRASNQTTIDVKIPDDGDFRMDLTVVDNGGATATVSQLFSAGNRAPTVVLNGPAFGRVNQTLLFTYSVVDTDGILTSQATWNGSDATVPCLLVACPFSASFDTAGVHQVAVLATDDDGAVTNKTFDVLIDGINPTSAIAAPAAPNATNGWFTEPVDVTITRADTGGSGVAFSTVTIDGVSEVVAGNATIERTLESDGVHVISVVTTDRAGNTDLLSAVTRTVKIDMSKPAVSLVGPVLAEGSPLSGVFFTDQVVDIVANATDLQSGITKVEFFVDGGDAAGVSVAPGTDGLFHFAWTASGTGMHEIVVLATNAAGFHEISDTITILVI